MEHLDGSAALNRETHPEEAAWMDGSMMASLLADVFDLVAMLRYEFDVVHARNPNRIKVPEPHPRPWATERDDGRIRFGSDPIPVSEFDDWWENG